MRAFALAAISVLWHALSASAAEPALPVFTDVTEKAGIQFKQSIGDMDLSNIVEGTGTGGMFFDYDGDGWLDIYLCNGRWTDGVSDNTGRRLRGKLFNKLYRNNRDGTFTDVTEKAGVAGKSFASGCSAADFDGDGDLDLYVLCYGPNELYRNNGDGTFTDISKQSGLADPRWSLAAGWFDYNDDDQRQLHFLQGDTRRAGNASDGVIARSQIADVLVASLTSPAADRKTFELVAERGPAQPDLEPLFAALRPDVGLDGPADVDNQPIASEPAQVRLDLERLTGIAQP